MSISLRAITDKFKNLIRDCVLVYYYNFRKKNNRNVYFSSFTSRYCDSPRAIADALYKLDPTVHQIWEATPDANMPDYVEKAITHKQRLKARAQSRAWVLGMGTSWKPKDVLLVATWHGDRGFKKILLATPVDAPETNRGKQIIIANKNIDIFTSGSSYGEMQAREGLGYEGYIQPDGLPRNDVLVNHLEQKENIARIKQRLAISDDSKILLFAPTFRDSDKGKQVVDVDLLSVLNVLHKNDPDWIVLVRSHKCSQGFDLEYGDKFRDISDYDDMSDLLLISDCLITDYSSSAGDFVLTGRPCILTHFDRKEYESNSRELWFDPAESGFLIAENNDDLLQILDNLYEFDHTEISDKVLNFYGAYESGKSARITAEKILDWVNK